MQELRVDFIPCASIAKENEEIFLPHISEPIILPPHSMALYLLQRIRDEAHRTACGYYHKLHTRKSFASALDAIPGIGPKRKRALLKKFGSVKAIRQASADELTQVKGMTKPAAEKVKEYL
jgi:excinuclease ABC subunit C